MMQRFIPSSLPPPHWPLLWKSAASSWAFTAGKGCGLQTKPPCCPKWFYCFLYKQCIGFVQRFLSNKINVNIYKLPDKMWHTQHHRSQAQLSKRETVLLLFENSRKRTGGGELWSAPVWEQTVHSMEKREAEGLGLWCVNFLSCAVIGWPFPPKLHCH